MAQFDRGTTYALGSTVTSTNFEALLESAALSEINRGDVDPDNWSFFTKSSVPPSFPYHNEIWMHEQTFAMASYDATLGHWQPALRSCVVGQWQGSSAVAIGECVRPTYTLVDDAVFGVQRSKADEPNFGFAGHAAQVNGDLVVVTSGNTYVRVFGSVSAGDGLVPGGEFGKVITGTDGDDIVAIALEDKTDDLAWALVI